jgi:DNA-binding transcriptional ArsR family regulator
MEKDIENNGMGDYQKEKMFLAQRSIYKALADGQAHRNKELRDITKLSPRTLSKHLDKLEKLGLILKETDTQSGKYPFPVFYKASEVLQMYMKSSLLREDFAQKVDAMLEETKDPLMILEVIHDYSQLAFIHILKEIQSKRALDFDYRQFLEDNFLWSNYRLFTMKLIEVSLKIADTINIDQLLISQASRLREVYQGMEQEFKKIEKSSE